MLSFCTCLFGRGWQLRISLPINLAIMEKYEMTPRFCISLFRPTEDQLYNVSVGLTTFPLSKELVQEVERDFQETKKWILENCQEELRSGKLVCSVHRREFFHSSVCKNTCPKLALLEAWQRGRGLYRWLGLTLEAHPKCNLDADNILSADFPSQIDFHLGHKIESACVRCPPTRRCVAGDDVRMLWLKSQPIPGRMTETAGVGRQMVFSNLAVSENSVHA